MLEMGLYYGLSFAAGLFGGLLLSVFFPQLAHVWRSIHLEYLSVTEAKKFSEQSKAKIIDLYWRYSKNNSLSLYAQLQAVGSKHVKEFILGLSVKTLSTYQFDKKFNEIVKWPLKHVKVKVNPLDFRKETREKFEEKLNQILNRPITNYLYIESSRSHSVFEDSVLPICTLQDQSNFVLKSWKDKYSNRVYSVLLFFVLGLILFLCIGFFAYWMYLGLFAYGVSVKWIPALILGIFITTPFWAHFSKYIVRHMAPHSVVAESLLQEIEGINFYYDSSISVIKNKAEAFDHNKYLDFIFFPLNQNLLNQTPLLHSLFPERGALHVVGLEEGRKILKDYVGARFESLSSDQILQLFDELLIVSQVPNADEYWGVFSDAIWDFSKKARVGTLQAKRILDVLSHYVSNESLERWRENIKH